MKPSFVLRLLRYRAMLSAFVDEKRGSGILVNKLTVGVGEISKATSIPLDVVRDDLTQIGFGPSYPLLASSVETKIDVALRSQDVWYLEEEAPSFKPEIRELPRELHRLPEDLDLAEAREKAWAAASDHADAFSLSLATFVEDRSPKLHQFNTLQSLFGSRLPVAVIADEVGLGKTVTSGMVLMELLERKLVSTCLLIVPPNLRIQWEEQFHEFFNFTFASVGGPSEETTQKILHADFVLVDYHQVREDPFRSQILARSWDLLLLDEAHRLRNAGTLQSTVCFSIRATFRIFLTATPVHNSAMDIYHLATQLMPGFLGTELAFKSYFISDDNQIREPSYLRERLSKIQLRTKRSETHLKFARRIVETVDVNISPEERELYDSLLAFLQSVKKYYPGAIELAAHRTEPQETQSIVVVAMTALRQLSSHPKNTIESLRTTFRKRVSASPVQLRGSSELRRIDELVDKYSSTDWAKFKHSKTERLLHIVGRMLRTANKIVVYAEFVPTAKILRDRLDQFFSSEKTKVFLLYGAMSRGRKDRVRKDFESCASKAILVSTDCGGEGLNLQFATGIINFDFPWNPMKVEQRIGRIDRIGQDADEIFIWNLVTRGTIERYVYNTLQGKLKICDEIMGDYFDSIITRMVVWQDHSELGIGQIIMTSSSAEEFGKRIDELDRPPSERLLAKARMYGRQSRIKF